MIGGMPDYWEATICLAVACALWGVWAWIARRGN